MAIDFDNICQVIIEDNRDKRVMIYEAVKNITKMGGRQIIQLNQESKIEDVIGQIVEANFVKAQGFNIVVC